MGRLSGASFLGFGDFHHHFFERFGFLLVAFVGKFTLFLGGFLENAGLLSHGFEFFDAALGVDESHFTSKEWMASRTNFDVDCLQRRAGFEGAAAVASDFGVVVVFGVNGCFHGFWLLNLD